MTLEKWIIHPGETRVIDIETVRKLKVGLVGGQIDVDRPRRAGRPHRGARRHHQGPPHRGHRRPRRDRPPAAALGQLPRGVPQLRRRRTEGRDQRRGPARRRPQPRRRQRERARLRPAQRRIGSTPSRATSSSTASTGDLSVNAVSGDVQMRELVGALNANSVSGDVAATGSLRKATIDTVSGAMLVDSTGDIALGQPQHRERQLDDPPRRGLPANYVVRSVSGRVQVDGVVRSGNGTGPTTNYTGSVGELSGTLRRRPRATPSRATSRCSAARRAAPAHRVRRPRRRQRRRQRRSATAAEGLGEEVRDDPRLLPRRPAPLPAEPPRRGSAPRLRHHAGALGPHRRHVHAERRHDLSAPREARRGGPRRPSRSTAARRSTRSREAGHAEVAARAGDLEGIEAGLADSVRLIADEVRGSVREAMKSLRADLAAAARDERRRRRRRSGARRRDDPRILSREQLQPRRGAGRTSSGHVCAAICGPTSRAAASSRHPSSTISRGRSTPPPAP